MQNTDNRCPYPGCDQVVEQPAGGGPRKRFCSDQHRVQFWRQTRPKPEAGESSPVLVLRNQLEQGVAALDTILARTRSTLLELANLDEAEALRSEVLAAADERVSRALAEKAGEERRRHTAETLAEAATQAAQEAQAQVEQARAEVSLHKKALLEAQALQRQAERERDHAEARHKKELTQALQRQERSQDRLERVLDKLRVETEARIQAEARAKASEPAKKLAPRARKK